MDQFQNLSHGPGRPQCRITMEVNFNNPQKAIDQIKLICRSQANKEKVKFFAKALLDLIENENVEKSSQTENEKVEKSSQTDMDISEFISEVTKNASSDDLAYLISSMWIHIYMVDKVKLMMMFFNELSFDRQVDFFAFLGHCLNEDMYKASIQNDKTSSDLNLDDLKASNKSDFYQRCDKRLKYFIDNLTERAVYKNENLNFKSNIYENILKARNSKFISEAGLKEHMVAYLASGKSMHTTQVFSKQGGKGTRPILEKVLKNSEEICAFSAPEKTFLFFSFDNIQKLLKSYRIGGNHQKKILAIVVCSILCLFFGDKKCELQYKQENSPAHWYSEYTYVAGKQIFVQQLSSNILKKCVKVDEEDNKVINDFFENELKEALDAVTNDMDENQQDSVDLRARAEIAKKRKLCHSGHINDQVRSNRTICDRQYCKAKLKESGTEIVTFVNDDSQVDNLEKENLKAKRYLDVPNITIDDTPKEMAVGAVVINPNTPERIAKVLDVIIESADMKNKFSVKIVLADGTVTKVFNENEEFRKFVVVTADGLPYKAMIELIKNVHTCAECGKRLRYIADMTDHMQEFKHKEFYQTYGNILPNIGHFHYSLTMLRSLVKLEWKLDYQELVKSIHFETPKALFMQEKVTDFRKSLDTYRTAREAKLREFVTPYVKYARENNLDINVASFLLWKKFFVKSQTYEALFQIEKYYGTSFLLFHSSLRANNFKLVKTAKKIFSSLFHINRHPNYAIMDIHTEYLDEKLSENLRELCHTQLV